MVKWKYHMSDSEKLSRDKGFNCIYCGKKVSNRGFFWVITQKPLPFLRGTLNMSILPKVTEHPNATEKWSQ
ncbi:MAG: hypothetical protein KatS3mg101_0655 [Patescibacteria group bacterium]|nr:MAG: hypothetical protein KatS3mg101_0655 [Patescibacteria group bacterium]